jgi:hypothetical protein
MRDDEYQKRMVKDGIVDSCSIGLSKSESIRKSIEYGQLSNEITVTSEIKARPNSTTYVAAKNNQLCKKTINWIQCMVLARAQLAT